MNTSPPPNASLPPGNLLGTNPASLGAETKLDALSLKARILAGEKVPIEDLKAFILKADADLTSTRKRENKVEKATDVDFF